MAYLPVFMKSEGCPYLIVGGGKAALRKIEVLSDFGADITVIAPKFIEEIQSKREPHIQLLQREFEPADLDGMDVVIVATNDKKYNHEIANMCKVRNIPVNTVDQIEDCTFIFPSYVKQGDVVAAFCSSGKSPVVTQYLKKKAEPLVTKELAELTEYLGSLRAIAKETIVTERERKAFFEEVLLLGISKGEIPSETEIENIKSRYQVQ